MRGAATALEVRGISKTFLMHMRGGARIPVLDGVSFDVHPSQCVALVGPSGAGKSSLLRMIYGNYRCDSGAILVRRDGQLHDLVQADPREVIELRCRTIGYVSQFLRVIPRVPSLSVVAAAGQEAGLSPADSLARAKGLLTRLNIQERLWDLPPTTFSGGEQQRVNIARGLIGRHAILLLDEPTASLDTANRDVVVALIQEAKQRGAAIVGIFHDLHARRQVADREIELAGFAPKHIPGKAA
jgi:alpha-D-ribose 1-methylphosphonate 5-triphosphate synthase subunit PhnL